MDVEQWDIITTPICDMYIVPVLARARPEFYNTPIYVRTAHFSTLELSTSELSNDPLQHVRTSHFSTLELPTSAR